MIANTAEPMNKYTLYALVIASTPMFSPYVVFGGPPISDAINVATPSPKIERCKPGFSIKSLLITFPSTI